MSSSNLTSVDKKMVVCYLTRLFKEVTIDVVATSAAVVQIRTPSREYYLHISHGPEMSLTEMEVQGTRDECDACALLVHTGNRRYLVVEGGSVAAGPPCGSARELSLSPLTRRGDPPPSWPRGGWRHHAIF
jgi:hypothetical protein